MKKANRKDTWASRTCKVCGDRFPTKAQLAFHTALRCQPPMAVPQKQEGTSVPINTQLFDAARHQRDEAFKKRGYFEALCVQMHRLIDEMRREFE